MCAAVGAIVAVGVALDRATEVMRDDVLETLVSAPRMPVINGVAAGTMRGSEVTLSRFAFAEFQVFDRVGGFASLTLRANSRQSFPLRFGASTCT